VSGSNKFICARAAALLRPIFRRFRNMLNFLRKFFRRPPPPEQPRLVLPTQPVPPPPPRPASGTSIAAREEWARQAAKAIDPNATAEELCGLTPDMTEAQISERLAMLYRRHNRAAASLEARLREEAEIMLDVIAAMRQKYLP
jgi:hypothetical protein